ncbi:MAG: phosphohistidine phosphatase SixA [Desulfobacula sp.]|nr:phosphohistidine phosphatase SixA [Desulfobacula sp.]
MAIFLVQHGMSLPKDRDPEKGLSNIGQEDTKKIAEVAKVYKIPVLKIIHSGKKRARQTAVIFNETLSIKKPCEQIHGIKPLDDVKVFGNGIDPLSNVMVVGHLPFMERLVSYLTTGSRDLKVYKFQNSGIVCLDYEDETWFIKWTLNPDIS